jgi:hypothetical protein
VWSLGFEFWYYALFAAFWFLKGSMRVLAICLISLFVGPRVLLLFPLWAMGSLTYLIGKRWRPAEWLGWILAAVPVVFILTLVHFHGKAKLIDLSVSLLNSQSPEDWRYCGGFLWFYVLGLSISIHFLGVWSIELRIAPLLGWAAKAIRSAAGLTLSIYLFHCTLLIAMAAVLNQMPKGLLRSGIIFGVAVGISCLLGMFFEPRRYELRSFLFRVFGMNQKTSALRPAE